VGAVGDLRSPMFSVLSGKPVSPSTLLPPLPLSEYATELYLGCAAGATPALSKWIKSEDNSAKLATAFGKCCPSTTGAGISSSPGDFIKLSALQSMRIDLSDCLTEEREHSQYLSFATIRQLPIALSYAQQP